MRALVTVWAWAAVLALAGCTRPATAFVVQIDSDLPMPDELATVSVETLTPEGAPIERRVFPVAGALRIPFSFTVVPAREERRALSLRITAQGRTGTPLVRRWSSEFQPEQTLFVSFFLTARCRTETCSGTQTCGDEGRCVEVYTDPSTLPPFVPNLDLVPNPRRDASVADARDAVDAPLDAPLDRPLDAFDAGRDVPSDRGPEVVTDTGRPDAGFDTGFDTGSDAGLVRLPRGVAMGEGHTCAIRWGNTVYCWGDNTFGQLGADPQALTSTATPSVVAGLTRRAWATVAAGRNHTCVLPAGMSGARPLCWGQNSAGQVDPGARTVPTVATPREVGADLFVSLCAGERHACGVRTDGAVVCWGSNLNGQVHPGLALADFSRGAAMTLVARARAVEVGCGQLHTCARLDTGQIWCWGDNASGQLGVGDLAARTTPTLVNTGGPAVQLAVGGRHTCVRTQDAVRCWGDTSRGQVLPSPSVTPRPSPYPINNNVVSGVTSVVAGQDHTCVITSDRLVRCWGDNRAFQSGIQRANYANASVGSGTVVGVVNAEFVAAGVASTCATLQDGTIRCWGRNGSGQLGDGSLTARATPRPVVDLGDVIAVATGDKSTCAVDARRAVWCWGANDNGQLGDGFGSGGTRVDSLLPSPTPRRVVNASGTPIVADDIALGADFACARTGSSLACWGDNSNSQLAQADLRDQSVAVNVRLLGVRAFAVGASHGCAVADDDANGAEEVYCWGNNSFGQRGDEMTMNNINAPRVVPDTAGARTVATALTHTITQLRAGAVRAWGANSTGQLSSTPSRTGASVLVGLPNGAYEFAVGVGHSCARNTVTGAVSCWGNNEFGQTGRPLASTTPVAVVQGVEARAGLVAMAGSTCVLHSGAVSCWGKNQLGQLGVEGIAQSYMPVRLMLPGSPIRLGPAGSANHACAIVGSSTEATSGRLYCWGSNSHGQLGDGTCGRSDCAATTVLFFP